VSNFEDVDHVTLKSDTCSRVKRGVRRPDSSTVINTGQRLILNRDGVRALATLAAEQSKAASVRSGNEDAMMYLDGVSDALKWLAGDAPDRDLQRWLGVEP
jgi:hypothetical protein